jgi:hypothetical protein
LSPRAVGPAERSLDRGSCWFGDVVFLVEEEKRGFDPSAYIRGVGQVKLGEDRVHVLLDGSFGQNEGLGDRGVAFAGGDFG